MKTGVGSKLLGVVLTLGLTGMALGFLIGTIEGPRDQRGPETVFAAIAAGAIFFALLRGPIGRAIGKMLESGSEHDEYLAARVEELEAHVSELGADQMRMAELEERVDFAERLLAQRDLPSATERREG